MDQTHIERKTGNGIENRRRSGSRAGQKGDRNRLAVGQVKGEGTERLLNTCSQIEKASTKSIEQTVKWTHHRDEYDFGEKPEISDNDLEHRIMYSAPKPHSAHEI
ncbi:hypothetical protein EVAR_35789_1 [Eumeta japonica]|uniref:Uncharacterized protein n=1 Tax=Eumeta variegata TaxID=151549 RepID=A0A4C1WQI7_EUMVA|nr:hypothetical protein EVAR_35789_1 [Eumeta japonica]